jgi:hypothetical protein
MTEQYTYDDNGNRLTGLDAGSSSTATYDSQDERGARATGPSRRGSAFSQRSWLLRAERFEQRREREARATDRVAPEAHSASEAGVGRRTIRAAEGARSASD